jgi:hypothetical protein
VLMKNREEQRRVVGPKVDELNTTIRNSIWSDQIVHASRTTGNDRSRDDDPLQSYLFVVHIHRHANTGPIVVWLYFL